MVWPHDIPSFDLFQYKGESGLGFFNCIYATIWGV